MPISQERRLIQVTASFVSNDAVATDVQVNERFSAPFEILQPPACPKTGGASLNDLQPATVLEATPRLLHSDLRPPTSDFRPPTPDL